MTVPTATPISDRALNRATLARQGLLERQAIDALSMLRHLIGLQGQVHKAPYVGLWSRLSDFQIAELEDLLTSRQAVRATLMRVTLHVAAADDFLGIRPLIDPVAWRGFRTNHLKALKGADVEEIRTASRALLDAETLPPAALGARLQTRWPEVGAVELSMPARFLEPVVHVPPAGLFRATRPPELTTAQHWLGRSPSEPIAIEALLRRYLAAFGPATANDFNAWSGLSGGAGAVTRLGDELVAFTGSDGRTLFDLNDAPRPPEDTPAPARLLPDYDNVIVGYADRTRILSPAHYKGLWRANGLRPAFTVDGMVRGSWKLSIGKQVAGVAFAWFDKLSEEDRAALEREGRSLLKAVVPGHAVEIGFAPFDP